MGKLLEELKRRKVFRVAAVYAVIAWGLIQVADTIAPMMNLPDSAPNLVLFLLIILFPIAVFLAWAYEVTPEGVKPDFTAQPAPNTASNTDRKLIYAIFALVLLVAGFQLSDQFFFGNVNTAARTSEPAATTADSAVLRASLILDQSLQRFPGIGLRTLLDIAPDGSSLTYMDFESGKTLLRDLATGQTQEILSGFLLSRFSPNGQQLLVYSQARGESSIMPAQGGGLRSLPIEATSIPGWLSDEALIYRHTDGMKIFSLTGGIDELIPGFDNSAAANFIFPLPNDSAFLFAEAGSPGALSNPSILAYDLSNQATKPVIIDGYSPQYVYSGHVLFTRDGDLWAVPFDPDSLEVTGAEALILEGVDAVQSLGLANYTVSDSGRLVYLPGREFLADQTVLVWIDRLGNRTELPLPAGNYTEPRLSPNGDRLVLTSFQPDGSSDVWVHDFSNGNFSRVTFTGNARNAVWAPEGSQLVYQQNNVSSIANDARGELWIMNANGTGQAERILDGPAKVDSISPIDGKVIYMTGGAVGTAGSRPISLSTLTLNDGSWVSAPLFQTAFHGRVSPDGRWIAYTSGSSGRSQVYVQPYPNLEDGRWQISSDAIGNREPTWGPNGDELFFLRLDGSLMHVEIAIEGDSFSWGAPQLLFANVQRAPSSPSYVVSNDGERFLHVSQPNDEQNTAVGQDHAELIVVGNWFEELRRLAPADPQ